MKGNLSAVLMVGMRVDRRDARKVVQRVAWRVDSKADRKVAL